MREIKIFGRGGQGAVTAAQILATAAFQEGYWSQTFPQFGAERRGAPVIAYIRMDKEPISVRNKVYAPDVVIVMDFSLFKMTNPLDDLKPDGTVILNFPDKGLTLPADISKKARHLYTVDASSIAHRIYGRTAIPITNIIILGAYCAALPDVSLKSIQETVADFFPKKKVILNQKAAQVGFENVRGSS